MCPACFIGAAGVSYLVARLSNEWKTWNGKVVIVGTVGFTIVTAVALKALCGIAMCGGAVLLIDKVFIILGRVGIIAATYAYVLHKIANFLYPPNVKEKSSSVEVKSCCSGKQQPVQS